jgi:hypothetical protein
VVAQVESLLPARLVTPISCQEPLMPPHLLSSTIDVSASCAIAGAPPQPAGA